jgi:hypothetical protein
MTLSVKSAHFGCVVVQDHRFRICSILQTSTIFLQLSLPCSSVVPLCQRDEDWLYFSAQFLISTIFMFHLIVFTSSIVIFFLCWGWFCSICSGFFGSARSKHQQYDTNSILAHTECGTEELRCL